MKCLLKQVIVSNGNNNRKNSKLSVPAVQCLNIAGIENFPELQAALPRAWTLPDVTAKIR